MVFGVMVRKTIQKLVSNQREPVKRAVHNLMSELRILKATRRSRMEFNNLKSKGELRVQLGCGQDIRSGWVNVDLDIDKSLKSKVDLMPDTVFINHDLRLGLPLESNSCRFIYSSHFLEHLEYKQGIKLLRECYHALSYGGVFRIALPNYRGIFDAYLKEDYSYFQLIDDANVIEQVDTTTKTICDFVNFCVYQYGEHKCIYDEAHLSQLLKEIGYSMVEASSFQDGIDPSTLIRQHHSFYIEAKK